MTALGLFSYVLPLVIALVAGAASGGLTAWWLLRQRQEEEPPEPMPAVAVADDTEFINSEIDLASVSWAEAHNLPPEAAGLMATRLKTLHEIGKGKGWF